MSRIVKDIRQGASEIISLGRNRAFETTISFDRRDLIAITEGMDCRRIGEWSVRERCYDNLDRFEEALESMEVPE